VVRAYIALGSNVGDRLAFLRRAVACLRGTPNLQVTQLSSVYETEPIGVTDQSWFLNAVVEIDTSLSTPCLLAHTQAIERGLARVTTHHWGPRTIDLDILLFGDLELHTTSLTIPHPELHRRAFVMIPLLEINAEVVLPDGMAVGACLDTLTPPQEVRLFGPPALLES
jgi:2-amino-4-hydroxy-6-hydroxymethyldihydropteridine diphosphokinase